MYKNNSSKKHIINAAKSIFSKYGYKKTAIDDIIRLSGKSKGAFYYYFKNKDDIFKSVILNEADTIQKKLISSSQASTHSIDKLSDYINIKISAVNEVLNLYNVMNNDFLGYLDYIRDVIDQHTNFEQQLIQNIIKDGVKKNEMKCSNPELSSFIILNMINSFEIFVNAKGSDLNLWIKEFINIITNGLKKDA